MVSSAATKIIRFFQFTPSFRRIKVEIPKRTVPKQASAYETAVCLGFERAEEDGKGFICAAGKKEKKAAPAALIGKE